MMNHVRDEVVQAGQGQFLPYRGFFPNLVRGRQDEFLVYREMYKLSVCEELRDRLRLNIYDQITDIDGIDVVIRCEEADTLLYVEAQVRRTRGRLDYTGGRTPLKHLVERSIRIGSRFVVMAVDYGSVSETVEPTVHFYTALELWQAHRDGTSFSLRKLDDHLQRQGEWRRLFETYLKGELRKARALA